MRVETKGWRDKVAGTRARGEKAAQGTSDQITDGEGMEVCYTSVVPEEQVGRSTK